MLNYYQNSLSASVMDYLPEYKWKEWLFVSGVPDRFWENKDNQHRYMKWLGQKLNFQILEEWYNITAKDFTRNKGVRILKYYQSSPAMVVMDYLPEYDWKRWLFVGGVPDRFWENSDNRRQYMKWLEEKLAVTKPEDWYKITHQDFCSAKGGGLLAVYYQGSPVAANGLSSRV